MPNPQRIGLYLTDDNIILTVSDSKKLEKISSSSITSSVLSSQEAPLQTDIPEEIHLIGTFQRLLRDNRIEPGPVCVSIPIKDIFLRSFVVPVMPVSELNNVVFYEAKKYVPFDLKLLDYVYQAIPSTENKKKGLRIVFYAIRKQTIEKYDRIFKQTGCRPLSYEPSLVSLAKYLISKKLLQLDQKSVVVYVHDNYGQIIFYEKGVSYFVREISLSVNEVHDPKAVGELLRTSVLREVEKSLGYYSRQFGQEKVKDLLLLTTLPNPELAKMLAEELSVKVRIADASVTVGFQKTEGLNALCASGVSIIKNPANLLLFNFLQAKAEPQPSLILAQNKDLPKILKEILTWQTSDFYYALQAAVVCILLLGGGVFYSRLNIREMQNKSNALILKQEELAQISVEDLHANTKKNEKTLAIYKKILSKKNHLSPMLIHLTKALPQGSWLDSVSVSFVSNPIAIDIKGYIVSNDGMQFKRVNDFLTLLKKNESFSKGKIQLKTTQKQKVTNSDQEIVYFYISG